MKVWNLFKTAIAIALLSPNASGYANPGACSGQCWSHDPSVIRRESDGMYFRFETGSRIGMWKAGDLTGPWVYQGAAIPGGSKIDLPGRDDLWAPDVHKVGNNYALFYSVSEFGSQYSAIGYATSPDLEHWTDHGSTGIQSDPSKTYNAIDGNLIQDTSGNYFMNFGSFWGDIFQVPMNAAGTVAAGAAYNLVFNGTGAQAVEGSYMYRHEGYCYLFFSSGVCCGYDARYPAQGEEYKIFVCRADSVSGPFLDRNGRSCQAGGGTMVLASHGHVYGPGGQGIFDDPVRGSVLYYHYADKNIGIRDADYQFGWNTVSWKDGWPTA